jgi:GntR family transcriptional regulator
MPRHYFREQSVLSTDVARLKPSPLDDTPKYLQIARNLERLIRENRWHSDDVLPPERHLTEMLGVSRTTARKAFQIAAERGLIDRRPGLGTYVSKTCDTTTTVFATILEQFDVVGSLAPYKWLVRECGIAGAAECASLALPSRSRVARLRRLVCKDNLPMAIEFSRVPEHVLNEPSRIERSIFKALDETEYAIVRVIRKFSATLATSEQARLLKIEPRLALLLETRVGYDSNGRAILFSEFFYQPAVYDFVIESNRTPET